MVGAHDGMRVESESDSLKLVLLAWSPDLSNLILLAN